MVEKQVEKFMSPQKSAPVLKFTPYAWAKLRYMRDKGESEVGGFGITPTEDPMLITDIKMVPQKCTMATVDIEGRDISDFVNNMMDIGLAPWQCSNIWIHTHPGNSAKPSGIDENNFDKSFSHPHWAIFYILAKDGEEYCRIRFNVGPGLEFEINAVIDYDHEFPASDPKAWDKEYCDNIVIEKMDVMFHTIMRDIRQSPISNKRKSINEDEERFREFLEMVEDLRQDENDIPKKHNDNMGIATGISELNTELLTDEFGNILVSEYLEYTQCLPKHAWCIFPSVDASDGNNLGVNNCELDSLEIDVESDTEKMFYRFKFLNEKVFTVERGENESTGEREETEIECKTPPPWIKNLLEVKKELKILEEQGNTFNC